MNNKFIWKKINISKRHIAFTLSEVLITLGIIGIVAEMTIPTLMNNVKKQDIVVRVKKVYSVLSQASLSLNYDCGGSMFYCITSPTSNVDEDPTSRAQLTNLYKGKLRVAKDCSDGVTTGCFPNVIYKYLNNNGWVDFATASETWAKDSQIVLTDGTSIAFDWNNNTAVLFFVDINGPKAPNQLGKDAFKFGYWNNTLHAIPDSEVGNECIITKSGAGCASKILREGEVTYY